MIEELLGLIDEYRHYQLLADSTFVNKMVITLVNYYDLHKYLDRVDVTFSNDKRKGSKYNSVDKVLTINLSEDYEIEKSLEMKENYYRWYNLEVTHSILHEIEHIIQEKQRCEKPYEFESELIERCDIVQNRFSIKEAINNYFTFRKYARCHDMVPIERMANYNANNTLGVLIDKIDEKTKLNKSIIKSYKSYFDDRKAQQLLVGYKLIGDNTNSPSMDYLTYIKRDDGILIPEGLSLDKRLYLGLPLNKKEFLRISK